MAKNNGMHTRLQSLVYFITPCSSVTKVTKRHRLLGLHRFTTRCALETTGKAPNAKNAYRRLH